MFRKNDNQIERQEMINTVIDTNIKVSSELFTYFSDGSSISVYTYSVFQPEEVEGTPLFNHYGQHLYNVENHLSENFLKPKKRRVR